LHRRFVGVHHAVAQNLSLKSIRQRLQLHPQFPTQAPSVERGIAKPARPKMA
jgi:hypothetical protein